MGKGGWGWGWEAHSEGKPAAAESQSPYPHPKSPVPTRKTISTDRSVQGRVMEQTRSDTQLHLTLMGVHSALDVIARAHRVDKN